MTLRRVTARIKFARQWQNKPETSRLCDFLVHGNWD